MEGIDEKKLLKVVSYREDVLLQCLEVAIKVKFKLIKPENDIPIIDFGTIEISAVIIETDSAEVLEQASMG